MALQVAELSLELIETLRPLVPRIKAKDKLLAEQITRAGSSIALNIGEAGLSDPGDRRARFFTAAGSAGETYIAERVAIGWRYVSAGEGQAALALLKRIIAIRAIREAGKSVGMAYSRRRSRQATAACCRSGYSAAWTAGLERIGTT